MSLDKAIQNLKLDTRLIEFNLNSGTLTKEDLQKHLQSLPDCAADAEKLVLEEELEETQGH